LSSQTKSPGDAEPKVRSKKPIAGQDGGPKVRAAAPIDRKKLIPIGPGSAPIRKASGKTDPYQFWLRYYLSDDPRKTDPEQLRETVRILNLNGKTRDAHAALLGFLKNHPNDAESWMYRALAIAIKENQGSEADIKAALNRAADTAQRSHNPNDLVGAADALYEKGYYERVGPLLDEAITKVPHRFEPLVGSINLAQKKKDPIRMADAVERLLSLGWPGRDEYFRAESRNQVETLAKSLREDGRGQEADALMAKLIASEARDLFVRLTWDGEADFDVLVDEPLGATASYQTPRTVFGGSVIKNGYGSHPEEVYVCPRAFNGDYTIRVSTIWTNPSKPVSGLKLETITHEGTAQEKKQVYPLAPDKPGQPIVIHVSGGRRKTVLPYVDPVAALLSAAKSKLGPKPPAGPKGAELKSPSADVKKSSTTPEGAQIPRR
jgi:tetratricopeptide (TPR) repeat protein